MTAMQTTGDTNLAALFNTYYTKRALERLVPKLHYYSFADKRSLPKGAGKTIDFFRWTNLSRVASNMTELTVPTQTGMSSVRVTATVIQRGSYNYVDELVDLTSRSPMIEAMTDLFGEQAAKTVDGYIQDVVNLVVADVAKRSSLRVNGRNTLNSSGIGVRIYSGSDDGESFPILHNKTRLATSSTVVSLTKSAMTYKTIRHAVSFLEKRNAMPHSNGNYIGIIHPHTAYQLETSTGFKGWLAATDSSPMRNALLGLVANVRFYSSSEAARYALSGDTLATGSGAIYGTMIVGRGAYGVTEIETSGQTKGFQIIIKKSGSETLSDPVSQKISVGWKSTMAAKVLNKSAGVLIATTEL